MFFKIINLNSNPTPDFSTLTFENILESIIRDLKIRSFISFKKIGRFKKTKDFVLFNQIVLKSVFQWKL